MTFKDFGMVASSLNTAYENRGVTSFLEDPVEVQVTVMTSDDILEQAGITAPDVIKIDAEAAALLVLKGLTSTIEACKPAMILEIGDDPKDPAIFEMLSGCGL